MPTTAINAGNLTLSDRIKRSNPDGSIAAIVEMLSKESAIIEDAHFEESNKPDGHLITQRTGLPSISYPNFNEGTANSKSKTSQFTEAMTRMTAKSVVDCAEAELNGDQAAYRASEDVSFMASMKDEAESGFFYNSTLTNPNRQHGLAPRLNSTTGVAGSQIVLADASASGADQTSIWLVGWGAKKVYGIYPKGSQAGIVPHDMGVVMTDDGTGKDFRAYVTMWEWKMGVVVEDWRYLVRIANIDTSGLAVTGDEIVDAMIRAVYKLQSTKNCKPVFYCNRTVNTYLHLQSKNSTKNSTLSYDNIGGQPVGSFLGIPIHTTDALLNTEAVIS